ncbi:hypothetical protein AB0J72_45455 [Dactylosporangium sp. NPDC049742]|uniref:hypothetical protein n=1 Tax=Dactylosporangium sp. NPDC049742 TaxID=3154737 RepID=UPI00344A96A4
MPDQPAVDERLKGMLSGPAARVLDSWAVHHQMAVRLASDGMMTGGTTDARVFVVYVRPVKGGGTKCILKYCPPGTGAALRSEPRAHEQALAAHPGFAAEHLVTQPFPPVALEDGGCLMFQGLAGGSLTDYQGMAAMVLDRRVAPAARAVVSAVLSDWNPSSTYDLAFRTESATVSAALGSRLVPRHGLADWLADHPELDAKQRWLELPGVAEPMPNPFALAAGAFDGPEVADFLGNAHGDLHVGNILFPQQPEQHGYAKFRLIDLSMFRTDASLARDPVHLLLSLVALYLPRLDDDARTAVRGLLLGRPGGDRGLVPMALSEAHEAILEAGLAWVAAGDSGLSDEWRQQIRLATVVGGLLFVGRRNHEARARWWFFELAAEAALDYLRAAGRATADSIAKVPVPSMPGTPGTADQPAGPSAARAQPAPLTPAQLRQLVDLLFDQHAMSATWRQLVGWLPADLTTGYEQHSVLAVDALNLFRYFGTVDPSPWPLFIETVEAVFPNSRAVARFKAELVRLGLLPG